MNRFHYSESHGWAFRGQDGNIYLWNAITGFKLLPTATSRIKRYL